jgi:hypothetical protein
LVVGEIIALAGRRGGGKQSGETEGTGSARPKPAE